MKRTIAILTSISMLLCSVPAFPVTARQPSKETYFLVADKNDNRAILFDLVKEKGNPYGYNSYEISDWSTGEGRYTAASADWDVGDILLYTGGYSYTDLPSPNSNYFIMKEDGSFEEVGVLPDTLQDAVQKDENGCFLYKGDDDATAALLAELSGRIAATEPATDPTEPTEPTEESVSWTEPPTTGSIRIAVVDAETEEPLSGVLIGFPGGSWVSDGTVFEGTYQFGVYPDRVAVLEVPTGYLLPDMVNYGTGHREIDDGERVDTIFRIPRDPDATEPTMPDPLPDPTYYKHDYVVLDKIGSVLYLLEYPCNVTTAAYEDNGANLPTYILKDDDPLFRSVIEEAEWGDIIEYTGTSLISTCLSCWNTLGRDGTPPDDETFVKVDSMLTNLDYIYNVTKWQGETYLRFNIGRDPYLVIRNGDDKPSFVRESDLISPYMPSNGLVLNKICYPENIAWDPVIPAHTSLCIIWLVPFFDVHGPYVETITDTDDPLFESSVAEAKVGDIIEYRGNNFIRRYDKNDLTKLLIPSEDPENVTFSVYGNILTDGNYPDNVTEWHGEKHLVLTSKEGTRYVVFADENTYPTFIPEDHLNDFGDLNHDGIHNASDAALILQQAALMGAQAEGNVLDPLMAEAQVIGDLDGDGISNASDAALLLIYAAYCGAQREAPADLQSYLYELNDTVKRVTIGYREGLSSEHVTKELLTSPAELETYFTETVTPQTSNMTDCLAHRDSAEVLAELMAAYPTAFFETHNLAVFCADEANHNNRQEVRQIETSDGGVTITMHHLDINGEPVEGFYAVLVAVDKRITDVSQITVNETHSRYTR